MIRKMSRMEIFTEYDEFLLILGGHDPLPLPYDPPLPLTVISANILTYNEINTYD